MTLIKQGSQALASIKRLALHCNFLVVLVLNISHGPFRFFSKKSSVCLKFHNLDNQIITIFSSYSWHQLFSCLAFCGKGERERASGQIDDQCSGTTEHFIIQYFYVVVIFNISFERHKTFWMVTPTLKLYAIYHLLLPPRSDSNIPFRFWSSTK